MNHVPQTASRADFFSSLLEGTVNNDTLAGRYYRDNMFGLDGNDTIDGNAGDDFIAGGGGVDLVRGGAGNDSYAWAKGNGADTLNDSTISTSDLDILVLTDVLASEVSLTRVNGSNDLRLTIPVGAGTEMITVTGRYSNASNGLGIEAIQFADGTIWTLDDIRDRTHFDGTSGNDSLTGSNYRDLINGLTGNDTIIGGLDNDTITGGDGTDNLQGGAGNDTYIWTRTEDNDTINDNGTSFAEADTLILTNLTSPDVGLTRASGSSNVLLTVLSTGEILTLTNQMNGTTNAYGIEVMQFSDGVIWTFEDLLDRIKVSGTSTANILSGTNLRDNLYGLAGNDTLNASNGDDKLDGGTGADSLNGSSGVDTASYLEAAQGVRVDLGVTTAQTGNVGGEEVGDILTSIEALEGSLHADILIGNADSNDLWGLAGNDSLTGKDGYDRLYGGDGADTLDGGIGADLLTGGAGNDSFRFTDLAFGKDEISDFVDGSDKLSFALTIADDISDFVISGNGTTEVTVEIGGQTILVQGVAPMTLAIDDFVFL